MRQGRFRRPRRPVDRAAFLIGLVLAGSALAGGEEPDLASAVLPGVGRVELRSVFDPAASPPVARLVLQSPTGAVVGDLAPLAGTGDYAFYQMTDARFADVDGDGRPDLVVVAQFMTGIGPSGAEPFPIATVYLGQEAGFERSRALEDKLNAPDKGAWDTAAGAVGFLKAH